MQHARANKPKRHTINNGAALIACSLTFCLVHLLSPHTASEVDIAGDAHSAIRGLDNLEPMLFFLLWVKCMVCARELGWKLGQALVLTGESIGVNRDYAATWPPLSKGLLDLWSQEIPQNVRSCGLVNNSFEYRFAEIDDPTGSYIERNEMNRRVLPYLCGFIQNKRYFEWLSYLNRTPSHMLKLDRP